MSSTTKKVIFKQNRHPIGLLSLYFLTVVALGASYALIIWSSGEIIDPSPELEAAALMIMGVLAAVVLVFLLLSTMIYWANSLVLYEDEVQQTLQKGLFSKQRSRLGLANVEDVTSSQSGILATVFGFGELSVETAGEQANFKFKYCPHPDTCAKQIMETREAYLGQNPDMQQVTR